MKSTKYFLNLDKDYHFVDNDKTRSDTSMFNDTVLKLLPKDFLNNQGVQVHIMYLRILFLFKCL